ncbi:hypothetical protein MMC19_003762, partial [Ptychographa xylographoides]|nr:hypothetical protein [Ptychographa xylographoides]
GDGEVPQTHQQQEAETDQAIAQRAYTYGQPTVSNPRALPPTPPLQPESGFDCGNQSPSVASTRSSNAALQQHSGSAINDPDPNKQRQHHPQPSESYSLPRQPVQSPYLGSPYANSPNSGSAYPYASPSSHPSVASSGMYYQQPLPATFPPPNHAGPATPSVPTLHNGSPIDHNNPWQHHHYISPSASAAYAGQTQDRYICQTCNKAFSRPSSLRIHSHSHTGEKPFKCPHPGCGKAFSVRSNMKRHERGCHGGGGSPGSS